MIKSYPDPFEPMTPDLAWVLGLYFTDGHVSRQKDYVSLYQKERELLENVKVLIAPPDDSDRPKLYVRAPSGFSSKPQYVLKVHSVQFVEYLEALGVHPRKSLTMQWPPCMTNVLLPDFVRGLIDGDGYIYTTAFKYGRVSKLLHVGYSCDSRLFIEALRDAITPIVKKHLKIYYDKTHKQLRVAGRSARALCAWMYVGSSEKTRLRRKYEIYTQQLARWEALNGAT